MSGRIFLILGALLAGCPDVARREAALPDAYELGGRIRLEKVAPQDHDDLKNVFRLGKNIVSGGEPRSEQALERISKMGVKTIISVDGKVPDEKTARKYGMRYVHVPLNYCGIKKDELLRLAKTYRELPGPFYVHCFHGRHRGPTGAAVGRLVLDGVPRERALAEMRQWCGTSRQYAGLFAAIARAEMPSAAITAKYAWDFPAAHPMGGFRNAMVSMARYHDNLTKLQGREWKSDPAHPDIDARNEAEKLAGFLSRLSKLDSVKKRPPEFREWLDGAASESTKMLELLRAGRHEDASKSFRAMTKTCTACHATYRNK